MEHLIINGAYTEDEKQFRPLTFLEQLVRYHDQRSRDWMHLDWLPIYAT